MTADPVWTAVRILGTSILNQILAKNVVVQAEVATANGCCVETTFITFTIFPHTHVPDSNYNAVSKPDILSLSDYLLLRPFHHSLSNH